MIVKIVINIVKWYLSVMMALSAIAGFSSGGFLSGILFLLITVAINPIVDDLLMKKNLRIKPIILIPSAIVLFLVACSIMPSTATKTDTETPSVEKQVLSTDDTTLADTSAAGERNLYASEEESKTSTQSVINQQEKEEQERLAKEQAEKEEQERLAKEQASTQGQNSGRGNTNNFNTYNNPEQQNTTDSWVLNTKSRRIHYPSCKDVKKISPENYSTSNLTLDDLKKRGYTACGHCF